MYLQQPAVDFSSASGENSESTIADSTIADSTIADSTITDSAIMEWNASIGPDRTVRILIVDDQIQIPQLLRKRLQKDGYAVSIAVSGQEALSVIEREGFPDLAVLDVMMPEIDGLALADRLKKVGNVPVVFLSAYSDLPTKVKAINLYGEDYIVKPYKYQELLARIRRILYRSFAKQTKSTSEITIDERLQVNFEQQFALLDERRVSLTPSESQLLKSLHENRGEIVSAETLLAEIRGPEHSNKINSLHVHVRRLRTKIETNPDHPRYVITVRGKGYTMPEEGTV